MSKTRRVIHNELVRDNIPNIMSKREDIVGTMQHQAKDKHELMSAIINKIVSIAGNIEDEYEDDEDISVEKLVDIKELVDKLISESGYTPTDIAIAKHNVIKTKGTFDLNTILDSVLAN